MSSSTFAIEAKAVAKTFKVSGGLFGTGLGQGSPNKIPAVQNDYIFAAIGEELGELLGQRCVQALGIAPADAHSYGKAAIVGEAGELEHAAALLHPKLGAPLRKAVEKGAALVPSAKTPAATPLVMLLN